MLLSANCIFLPSLQLSSSSHAVKHVHCVIYLCFALMQPVKLRQQELGSACMIIRNCAEKATKQKRHKFTLNSKSSNCTALELSLYQVPNLAVNHPIGLSSQPKIIIKMPMVRKKENPIHTIGRRKRTAIEFNFGFIDYDNGLCFFRFTALADMIPLCKSKQKLNRNFICRYIKKLPPLALFKIAHIHRKVRNNIGML
ncbi:hypothetical protein HMPREF1141_1103 [Clostridium sp. MSTE9]|nr:hypothetical protein HMPREF1141_1103 [Clostridium sp. MSTE9]